MDWASSSSLGLVEVGAGLEGVAVDAGRGGFRAAFRLILQELLEVGAGRQGARKEGFEALAEGAAFGIVR